MLFFVSLSEAFVKYEVPVAGPKIELHLIPIHSNVCFVEWQYHEVAAEVLN